MCCFERCIFQCFDVVFIDLVVQTSCQSQSFKAKCQAASVWYPKSRIQMVLPRIYWWFYCYLESTYPVVGCFFAACKTYLGIRSRQQYWTAKTWLLETFGWLESNKGILKMNENCIGLVSAVVRCSEWCACMKTWFFPTTPWPHALSPASFACCIDELFPPAWRSRFHVVFLINPPIQNFEPL